MISHSVRMAALVAALLAIPGVHATEVARMTTAIAIQGLTRPTNPDIRP